MPEFASSISPGAEISRAKPPTLTLAETSILSNAQQRLRHLGTIPANAADKAVTDCVRCEASGMDSEVPERLPPPPFWRTRYFAFDVLPRRPNLDVIEVRRIIALPERRMIQKDGRIRLYGYSESMGGYLRIVSLSDGETVHNAFPDEGFEP
jgi:hypothetical protein